MKKKEGEPDVDLERRAFLSRSWNALLGAGALIFTTLHSGALKALELPKGTGWTDGLRLLREAVTEQNENIGIFTGSRRAGEWVHKTEGIPIGIHQTPAFFAQETIRDGNPQLIREGLALYHTHTNSALEETYRRFTSDPGTGPRPPYLQAEHEEAIKDFIGAPSFLDANFATDPLFERYFELKGVAHGPVEHGAIAKRHRWTLRRIEGGNGEREEHHRDIKGKVAAWLHANPDFARALFRNQMRGEWDEVARADAAKWDILADQMVHWGALWQRPLAYAVLRTPGGEELAKQLATYWQRYSPLAHASRAHIRLMREMYSEGKDFNAAVSEYAAVLRDKCGLELTYVAHADDTASLR